MGPAGGDDGEELSPEKYVEGVEALLDKDGWDPDRTHVTDDVYLLGGTIRGNGPGRGVTIVDASTGATLGRKHLQYLEKAAQKYDAEQKVAHARGGASEQARQLCERHDIRLLEPDDVAEYVDAGAGTETTEAEPGDESAAAWDPAQREPHQQGPDSQPQQQPVETQPQQQPPAESQPQQSPTAQQPQQPPPDQQSAESGAQQPAEQQPQQPPAEQPTESHPQHQPPDQQQPQQQPTQPNAGQQPADPQPRQQPADPHPASAGFDIFRGLLYGAVAFLNAWIAVVVMFFSERPDSDQQLPGVGQGQTQVDWGTFVDILGWLQFNAHTVPIRVSDGTGTQTLNLLLEIETANITAYHAAPAVALFVFGFGIARKTDGVENWQSGFVAGASTVLGYGGLVAAGTILFEATIEAVTFAPVTGQTIVIAGLAYPLGAGGLAGALYGWQKISRPW